MDDPYKHPSGLSAGDEVWIRAVVTDPCTSCVGVTIKGITRPVSLSVRPQDVRADHVELRVNGGLFTPANPTS